MAQSSHRTLQTENRCNNVLQYTDTRNVNRTNSFRPTTQAQSADNIYRGNQICRTNLNNSEATVQQVPRRLNGSTSNISFRKPEESNRMATGASTFHESTSTAHNSLGSVFKNPGTTSAGTSRGNLNISVNSRRSNDSIALGVPVTTVQNKVAQVPKLAPISEASTSKKSMTEQSTTNDGGAAGGANFRVYGSTENEKMFIFTGTVESVIRWNKIFQNHFCYFEVIAAVISIQEGSIRTQKIMLLRDRKGPILQMIYYSTTHLDIEDFHVGQILRCVGKMSAPNILNAVSIRAASRQEIDTLQRLCLVCDHAVSHFLNV